MDSSKNNTFNLRGFLEKYLYHWKWFALGIILAATISFLYLRYATPKFKVDAIILINDKENNNSEISAFKDLGIVYNNSTFGTEIGVLRSRSLVEKVVSELGLNKTYLREGRIHNIGLYGATLPFKLDFYGKDSLLHYQDTLISIIPTSQTKFNLLDAQDKVVGSYLFGENIESYIANFTLTPTNTAPIEVGLKINVIITPLSLIANQYRNNLRIEQIDREANLIMISLEDPIIERAKDIVKLLIDEYNLDGISDGTLIAENTENFINERIDGILKELSELDSNTQDFKASNLLTDIDADSRLAVNTSSELEQVALDLSTQLKLVEYMSDFINNKDNELIPTNLGLSNMSLNQSTILYNEILLERKRLLRGANRENPTIINLDSQLQDLKRSISQSLSNLESSLTISLNDVRRQGNRLSSKITEIPKQQRQLKDIERQQQIVETLYLYLLEKREENAITLAVKSPKAKIIDPPYGSYNPVSPKRIIVYLIALMLGIIVPFMFLNLYFLLDNKVKSIEDMESVISAPILGDIPMSKNMNKFLMKNDGSPLNEALRVFRTQIDFVLSKNKNVSKNIFISSTIEGEGKTSLSIHLAKVLALSSKKVLLIEGDIRKPSVAKNLKARNKEGLTNYLIDDTLKPETLIESLSLNFDFLQSGTVPPNPSELIMNGRLDQLFDYTNKNYDFVIIDTSPVGMVTDGILLSQNRSDLFIYVVRANYLDKRMLKIPKKLYETKQLDNMVMVLNSSNPNLTYGYSQTYGLTKKPWWKKFMG
ncbi:polysaccharide biosynthesis tyrosine autokinase [Paucihalobacter ruber]|uniref:non-specific protein-tyrosine kinase n=1 Tax=Paucihalobacter ruber TaxID=2567861 RepID=A0A506PS23_9FLAO|nr:polysaccharide biosynthesis tyrosine autokinase [Paucihalobacter ruber]TPV35985.1 polysaccharide biosynthesis tyrosine autokinase [Paucihalobacter ruber]